MKDSKNAAPSLTQMQYGLGSTSARGTGTSGYIQRNLSQLQRPKQQSSSAPQLREPNPEILEHDRKRKIEIECIKLRDLLEEQQLPEEEIEAQVAHLRNTLGNACADSNLVQGTAVDSHEAATFHNERLHSLRSSFEKREL